MFLNFHIKNFFSIGDVKLDFSIKESQHIDDTSVQVGKKFANKLMCLVGPNASGKSNILRAITTFCSFVENSYTDSSAKISPHFFLSNEPIEFSAEFVEGEEQYLYEICLFAEAPLHEVRIAKEQLSKKNKKTNRYNVEFRRDGKKISNIALNDTDQGRLKNDVALFSFLKKLGYFENQKIKIGSFKNFATGLNLSGKYDISQASLFRFSEMLHESPELLRALIEEVKKIDLGIADMRLMVWERPDSGESKEVKILSTIHEHDRKRYLTPIYNSSDGTVSYAVLFARLHGVIKSGGLLVVDELESSLHTDLVERILDLFMKKESNPNNAQILFSTHNPLFLQYLTKTQIVITEKNEELKTEVFRLDEMKGVRNDENHFIKYLAGAYDGKPKIKGAVS